MNVEFNFFKYLTEYDSTANKQIGLEDESLTNYTTPCSTYV